MTDVTYDRAQTPEEEAALLAAREAAKRAQDQAELGVVAQAMAGLPPAEAPSGVAEPIALQESAPVDGVRQGVGLAPISATTLGVPPRPSTQPMAPALGDVVAYVLDDGTDAEALVIAENALTPSLLVQVAPEFTASVTRRQFARVPFGITRGCWHPVTEEG